MREITPAEALALIEKGIPVLTSIERRVYLRLPKAPDKYEVVFADVP